MPEKDSRHLLDRLAEIQDPRNEKGKRRVCKVFAHPITAIALIFL